MNDLTSFGTRRAAVAEAPAGDLVNEKQTAIILGISKSWLAKARMSGDGPPYIEIGRSIRYSRATLQQWLKSRQRLSTSERKSQPRIPRQSHRMRDGNQ
jgi:predicted DNA-binding transcriptional regulator AlpA